jgi:membrane AbrB-like protein
MPHPATTAGRRWRRQAETLLIATAGVAAFSLLGLPLPFLFGPMTACLLAALARRPLKGFGQVSIAARTILGVAVGSSVTPEVLGQLPQMAASVAFVPLYLIAIALIGVPFFRRVCGYDRATAYYAAMPGGLQDMVIFGAEAGGNLRALSLIHATRVMILVTLAPVILSFGFGASLDQPIGRPAAELSGFEMGLMVAAALIGWKGGEKLGLFGASILGPMLATIPLSLSGLITQRPPAEAILAAQFFIGTGMGVGYVGVTLQEVRRDIFAGMLFVVVLAVLAAVVTEIVVQSGLARPLEGFLSFAPGGQAEMTVLAIVSGADLGFVIIHHLTRIFLVITGAPLVGRLLLRDR